jgi:hypothetical protein
MHAIIIPVHKPKSNFIFSFLLSLSSSQHDFPESVKIYLACSFIADMHAFRNIVSVIPRDIANKVEVIAIEDIIGKLGGDRAFPKTKAALDDASFKGIINLKKLLALYYLRDAYVSYAIVDSDILAVGPMDRMFARLHYNFDKKVIPGNVMDQSIPIIAKIRAEFGKVCRSPVDEYIMSFNGWFFEPPYYTNNILTDFFKFCQRGYASLDEFFSCLMWGSFDDFFRHAFLQAELGYQRLILTDVLGHASPCEFLMPEDRERLRHTYGLFPIWISLVRITQEYTFKPSQLADYSLILHVDRN